MLAVVNAASLLRHSMAAAGADKQAWTKGTNVQRTAKADGEFHAGFQEVIEKRLVRCIGLLERSSTSASRPAAGCQNWAKAGKVDGP
jgi:hypothetical protein